MSKFILLAALLISGRKDVTDGVIQIHHDTFERQLGFEEAVLVRTNDIEIVSGTSAEIDFKWSDDIMAVIHTHPDVGFEKPSPQDVQFAQEHRIPVYVLSRAQIWYATPAGKIEEVK